MTTQEATAHDILDTIKEYNILEIVLQINHRFSTDALGQLLKRQYNWNPLFDQLDNQDVRLEFGMLLDKISDEKRKEEHTEFTNGLISDKQ